MLRVSGGTSRCYCDGLSRRHFLQIGVAGMASAPLSTVLRARAAASAAPGGGKDTSVILLWLDGGPGHMDMYDMKPEAPAEYRGIWRPIRTNVPGIEITELFPLQAKVADKFSIVRSLHHDTGDHFTAAHRMLTSRGGANGNSRDGPQPVDRLDRGESVRLAKAGHAGVRRRALCQQRRPAARLLRRQLSGLAVQSVRNRRRSERGRLSVQQSATDRRTDDRPA